MDEVYEGYSESEVKEIKGITDTVTDLSFTKLDYPAVIFKEGFTLPKHRAIAISNMVKSSTGNSSKDITLYFQNKGELFKMGKISGVQYSSLLDMVSLDNIIAFYEEGSRLEGGLVYTLCSFL